MFIYNCRNLLVNNLLEMLTTCEESKNKIKKFVNNFWNIKDKQIVDICFPVNSWSFKYCGIPVFKIFKGNKIC